MTKTLIKIICIIFIISQTLPLPALANFDPNYVISDKELTDYDSMHMGQIQSFLESKNSYLATYVDPIIRITAAQAIYDAARLHQINPKYILVLLQKEQSLVENGVAITPGRLDWATGYGICDSCKKTDAKVQKYKGFTNQVDWGAGGTRYYFDNPNNFKFQTGSTYNIDGEQVTIANDATRALYTYTPHLHGNENFYNIWQRWFASNFLEGSLLQDVDSGGIYLIRDGMKYPFLSKSAFLSRYDSFDRALPADPEELAKYPLGQAIEHPNYSLLQIPTGGIYLLDDDTLRPIVSKEAFRLLGYNPEEVVPVESSEIFFYKIGSPIKKSSAYPTGALLKDSTTSSVYFVKDGNKHPIVAPELIDFYYNDKKIVEVTPAELENYSTGDPVKLKDGELATAPDDPAVYVITAGEKRAFSSAEAFESLGYKWENILKVSSSILNLHETGELISTIN
jgi:hypothetical protein